jgi:glycosyltransferase involved in cell wall biosynthesis
LVEGGVDIHGICIVKNEADVIEECLTQASQWCDHIYVWDNGSTDDTWKIVNRLALKDPRIIAYKQEAVEFHDGLRGELFNAFAERAAPNDWWCRLDADEFYVENPRIFLRTVPELYGIVWYLSLSYYFSSADAQAYRKNPSQFSDSVPVAEKCRYYYNHWSEIRFVRHRDLAPWPSSRSGWPDGITSRVASCPVRILAKHFAYRSPSQIEQRIKTREAAALSGRLFNHEAISNWAAIVDPAAVREHRWRDLAYTTDTELLERGWESRVIDANSLNYDAHDGRYVINEHLMPQIPELPPSFALRALRKIGRIARRAVNSQS